MSEPEPLHGRVDRNLESMMLGVPVADHFLTLPSGMTLTIPDGAESWDVYTPHALASLAEGLCPLCSEQLSERRECFDGRHRPCRWHLCGKGWGQAFLDVPRRRPRDQCSECGEEM